MQLCAGMCWTGQAAASKRNSRHSEIAAVFLDENVGSGFGCAKERVLAAIDAHVFGDSGLVLVAGFNFPTFLQLAQWQSIRCIAVHFVGRCEDKWRFGTKVSCGLQQIQGAISINREVGLRFARRPIVRRL